MYNETYICLIFAGLLPSPSPVLGRSIEMPWEGTIPTLSSPEVALLRVGGMG